MSLSHSEPDKNCGSDQKTRIIEFISMSRLLRNSRRQLRRYLTPIALGILDLRCRFGPAIGARTPAKCTAVIASYLRPENIQTIVNALVKCKFIGKIVISNQNPDITMEDYVDTEDDRVLILNSLKREYPGYRFKVASTLPGEYFMILDDDIFMFPEQIRRFFSHLVSDPSVPHGFHGTRYVPIAGKAGRFRYEHIAGREAVVDILHQGYAVSDDHIKRMLEIGCLLAEQERFKSEGQTNFVDDIMISFSSNNRARVHNLAPILTCPTSLVADIAVSGQADFDLNRDMVFAFLSEKIRNSTENSSS
jgi:hypothetical protein